MSLPSLVEQETWKKHFEDLYDPERAPPNFDPLPPISETEDDTKWYNKPFQSNEVTHIARNLPDKKAAGPDEIRYEYIKAASRIPRFLTLLTGLLNLCLSLSAIPKCWKDSVLFTLYKGKGDKSEPRSYRGIALLNTLYKILSSLINKRLQDNIFNLLPPEQFGFRKGRNTLQLIRMLYDRAKEELQKNKGHLYVLYVDYRAAFDKVNRVQLIRKLQHQFSVDGRILRLIQALLVENQFRIYDGHTYSEPLKQHLGVVQGDALSPSLFILFAADLSDALREIEVTFLFYADDLVVLSERREDIQHALDVLGEWCRLNRLEVNLQKTKIMKFRKGGRVSQLDKFYYQGSEVEIVPSYEYLGVIFQTKLSFSQHIKTKKRKALAVIASLNDLNKTSLKTAMKIFCMKILPLLTYGMEVISPSLTSSNLEDLDRIKAAFLKKALCLHKSASSTVAHELASTGSLSEDLKEKGFLFNEDEWKHYQRKKEERALRHCSHQFHMAPAFQFDDWKKQNFSTRHFYTRASDHGFHFKLCQFYKCHDPNDDCVCIFCNQKAGKYHLIECQVTLDLGLREFLNILTSL